ncbi:MAG: FAD-dependent monooxygenase, partial [Gammaproteobacteria bacterium]|nr:FAD-dependent monooxygenase [Gammaproteobacteria bacterium]
AWQRFLPAGPLALLPLADGRSSVVWSNRDAEAEALLKLDDAAFVESLQHASAGVLGRIEHCTPRFAFKLRLLHARRYVAAGIALVGDAAHTVHPLAGQGMNLGLRDAAKLAQLLVTAVRRGEYPGDESVLRRYERAQKAHNLGMQLAFDGLNRLFDASLPAWAVPLRSFGMAAVDRALPAKRLLMRRALGLDAAQPRLDAA